MDLSLSEVVNLAVGLVSLPVLIYILRGISDGHVNQWTLAGFSLVVCSYVLTIAEGVGGTAGGLLNLGEHLALTLAGISFFIAAAQRRRSLPLGKGRGR